MASSPTGSIRKILLLTRPWEAPMHRSVVREVLRRPWAEGASAHYLCVWDIARTFLDADLDKNESTSYFFRDLAAAAEVGAPDERLKQLASDLEVFSGYSMNLLLESERYRPSDPAEARAFFWSHLRLLDGLISEGTLVFSAVVDHMFYWLASELAKLRGGVFVGLSPTARPSGHFLMTKSATEMWMTRSTDASCLERYRSQVEECSTGVKPDYMRKGFVHRLSPARRIALRRLMLEEMQNGNYFMDSGTALRWSKARNWSRARRWKRSLDVMESVPLSSVSEPFVYHPLHLEPELTTSVWCPMMKDPAFLIEALARSLPMGVRLLVKENPKMHGVRPLHFYERIRASPNVTWVDPATPTELLTRESSAVVGMTGTACLEATLVGKPAAIFGHPTWKTAMKSVPRFTDVSTLGDDLNRLLRGDLTPTQDTVEREYCHYLANLDEAVVFADQEVAGLPMRTLRPLELIAESLDRNVQHWLAEPGAGEPR